MNTLIRFLALLLCLVTVLMGCHRTTTVILPPETKDAGSSTAAPSTNPPATPATQSTMAPTAEPTTVPTTVPTTAPTTEPSTAPTTEPTAAPTTEPTAAPATEPTAAPTTEPTAAPTTEPTQHPVYDIAGHQIGTLEYALLDGINSQRIEQERNPLTLDATLCALARIRAYECTENFSQTRPDGRNYDSVLTDYGYNHWSDVSQRLHRGTTGLSSGTILKGWMYTPEFSGDILCDDFSHIGIGVYTLDGLTYIVCFFAR